MERENEQEVRVDLEIELDFAALRKSCDVTKTVDWRTVAEEVTALLRREKFGLAEAACIGICELILERTPATAVSACVTKQEAVSGAAAVKAMLTMTREELVRAGPESPIYGN